MIRRMSLGQKLTLLLFVPLLAVVVLTGREILRNLAVVQDAQRVVQLDRLTQDLIRVMEPLTAERGNAVNYLLNKDEKQRAKLVELQGKSEQATRALWRPWGNLTAPPMVRGSRNNWTPSSTS